MTTFFPSLLSRRRRFEGSNRTNSRRVILNVFKNDAEVLPRRSPSKGRREATAAAGDRRLVVVLDDLFDLLLRNAMLGDVLNVTLGVVFQIPDETQLRHARDPSS